MKEQHSCQSFIPPVPEGSQRPLWSVMIPTYNCAHYLRETLTSILAQDPGQETMQIEVVDDYSTKDDPELVVDELGKGRINFYRQPSNVGYIRNFETCLRRSRGHLVHLLHGDDCVRENFYSRMQQAFNEKPEIGAAFCRTIYMDECSNWMFLSPLQQPNSGILRNWLERIAVYQRIMTPSIVVRRDVYERLGGFDRRMSYWAEDWEMWVRIAKYYPVWYEIQPLALYRLHSSSLSGYSMRTGQNMRDVRKAIEIIQSYLPDIMKKPLLRQSREHYAIFALDRAEEMLDGQDMSGAIAQIREAIKLSCSMNVIWRLFRLFIEGVVRLRHSRNSECIEHE